MNSYDSSEKECRYDDNFTLLVIELYCAILAKKGINSGSLDVIKASLLQELASGQLLFKRFSSNRHDCKAKR